MKVLVITNLYPPHYLGGYELLCKQVCDYLKKCGHEVDILTSDYMSSVDDDPSVHRSLRLIQNFGYAFKDSLSLRMKMPSVEKYNSKITSERINTFKPDIIFLWSQLRLTLGCALTAELSGIPVTYSLNDEWPRWYKPLKLKLNPGRIIKYTFRNIIAPTITTDQLQFKNCVSISRCTRDGIASEVQTFTSKKVIYQGITPDDFPFKEKSPNGHTSRLLYVGQIYEDKGLTTLIEGLNILEKDNPSELTIVGDGPPEYLSILKNKAKTLESKVDFTGKVVRSKLPEIYQQHDIFIFPSKFREPFGLTHLEAMACGTPVVSSLSGGQKEFLKNKENCMTFETGNATDLAFKIKTLINDEELRLKIIQNARKEVEDNFTTERYLKEIHQHLMNLV